MVEESEIQILIAQAKQGDTQAFGQIFDRLSPAIFNFLLARIRQKETAEDLLQVTFCKAWSNLGTYRPKNNAKFSTWLFQIANYTLIDHWRTRKETVNLEKVDNLSIFAVDPKLYENYEYLWSVMRELPDDYQTVLDLRFRQDLTVSETAHVMNKTEVGIRVLQHRALKALKNKLSMKKLL